MAKLTKDELMAKVNASSLSEEEKVSFMEDISDSMEVSDNSELEQAKSDLAKKTEEYDSLLERYKNRFMSNEDVTEVKEEEKIETETEEGEVIDVTDIFGEKEDKE